MSRRPPALSDEDRILWNVVARTVEPLKGKRPSAEPSTPEPAPDPVPAISSTPRLPSAAPAQPERLQPRAPSGAIDRVTHVKLAKGRLPLEARVDLHGLTQREAHALLLSFLHRAHAAGARHVLVITGKGSSTGSEGVLRRAVPEWLRTSAFKDLVSAHGDAARGHGGHGAIYIRLRRNRDVAP